MLGNFNIFHGNKLWQITRKVWPLLKEEERNELIWPCSNRSPQYRCCSLRGADGPWPRAAWPPWLWQWGLISSSSAEGCRAGRAGVWPPHVCPASLLWHCPGQRARRAAAAWAQYEWSYSASHSPCCGITQILIIKIFGSIPPSIHPSVYLPIRPSIHPSIYLSMVWASIHKRMDTYKNIYTLSKKFN